MQSRGQVDGAIAMGLGWARTENMVYDGGTMVNPTLRNYRIPAFADVPPSEVFFADTYDKIGQLANLLPVPTLDAKKVMEERIIALGRAHDVLIEEHWESADLRELVLSIVQPYRAEHINRIEVFGPDLRVNPRAAVALAMVFNELMTNAAKYGALSQPEGRVRVEWSATEDRGPSKLRMVWMEMGGPLLHSPIRRGFGSTLIEQSITRELGGTLEKNFDPTGLLCTMMLPLERLLT